MTFGPLNSEDRLKSAQPKGPESGTKMVVGDDPILMKKCWESWRCINAGLRWPVDSDPVFQAQRLARFVYNSAGDWLQAVAEIVGVFLTDRNAMEGTAEKRAERHEEQRLSRDALQMLPLRPHGRRCRPPDDREHSKVSTSRATGKRPALYVRYHADLVSEVSLLI